MTMDYDVGNMRVLAAGAMFSTGEADGEWRSMDSAPRDGTYVELKNSYGVAPSYCIARWTDENFSHGQDGKRHPFKSDKPSWVKPDGGGPFDEGSLKWRPYNGAPDAYVDPTGGMQDSAAYWRGAVARKYGLPLDAFEKETAQNVAKNAKIAGQTEGRAKPWWRRLFS